MVKLTIDGTELQVKDGTTILDAALQAGIHIPTLCYLKKLNKIESLKRCGCVTGTTQVLMVRIS